MANINRKWKRVMAIGCTHGHLIDKEAWRKVLKFKATWKPHIAFHLGDVIDTACFRTGAAGTKDEAEPIDTDRFAARDHILAYEPNVITWGNHDWRLWELADHHKQVISTAARCVRDELLTVAKKVKAETRDYDIETGWYEVGGTKFGHGYMYDQSGVLSHARVFGRCVIAHLHRPDQDSADRHDHAKCTCVGYLGDPAKFGYARRRKGFFRWAHGLAYGEVCDNDSVIWLASQERQDQEWRLPL